jgi:hypothetical protein
MKFIRISVFLIYLFFIFKINRPGRYFADYWKRLLQKNTDKNDVKDFFQ